MGRSGAALFPPQRTLKGGKRPEGTKGVRRAGVSDPPSALRAYSRLMEGGEKSGSLKGEGCQLLVALCGKVQPPPMPLASAQTSGVFGLIGFMV